MYPIPREINSEIKITRLFYLSDIVFMSVVVLISLMFSSYVHSAFRMSYFFFCLLIGLFLSFPVRSSAGRRRWQSYLFWIFSDRKWYVAAVAREVKQSDEEKGIEKDKAQEIGFQKYKG
jgi:hypothetical protein